MHVYAHVETLFYQKDNTFQAVLITDGVYSYTIFTYKCGLMEWDNGAIIGYNAAGESFANHDPSTSDVACLNSPDSDYYNAIYLLSNESPEIPSPRKFPKGTKSDIIAYIPLHLSLQRMSS